MDQQKFYEDDIGEYFSLGSPTEPVESSVTGGEESLLAWVEEQIALDYRGG